MTERARRVCSSSTTSTPSFLLAPARSALNCRSTHFVFDSFALNCKPTAEKQSGTLDTCHVVTLKADASVQGHYFCVSLCVSVRMLVCITCKYLTVRWRVQGASDHNSLDRILSQFLIELDGINTDPHRPVC